jgi:hypothetical protein
MGILSFLTGSKSDRDEQYDNRIVVEDSEGCTWGYRGPLSEEIEQAFEENDLTVVEDNRGFLRRLWGS